MRMVKPIVTANQKARQYGTTKATSIIVGDETKVISYTRSGYVKNTTGQYVPKAYLSKFGWKNTHYQEALCVVQVNIENFY